MDTMPLYLIALVVALAQMGTDVYDVHAWNVGTVKTEPWRTKTSGGVLLVKSRILELWAFLCRHRQTAFGLALVALILLAPDTVRAHAPLVAAVGTVSVAQLETDLKAQQKAVQDLMEKQMNDAEAHIVAPATATTEAVTGRLRTPEEKAAVEALMATARNTRARIDGIVGDANLKAEIDRLTAGMTERPAAAADRPTDPRSMGAQFVADPGIRAWLMQNGHQQQGSWSSPGVELHSALLDSSGGSGGPLLVPDYRPGVIPTLFRRLVVADLIAPGTTDSNAIIYMKELLATNAAAAVAEGIAKPESALTFTQATDPVVKIATWIPVTTEMLEDFPAMQSLIDARLRMFLSLAEEDQLLNGSGTAPNMRGLMNRLALAAAIARGADSNADAVFKQISAIATNSFIQPDAFVMNPANWMTIQLTKNAAGNYLGTGPWAAAQQPMLWGLPGAITPAIVANTALVGAYQTCAQFFRRGGIRAAISNSHLGYFVENKVAVLIEERGALCVYRESAFGKVTGLA